QSILRRFAMNLATCSSYALSRVLPLNAFSVLLGTRSFIYSLKFFAPAVVASPSIWAINIISSVDHLRFFCATSIFALKTEGCLLFTCSPSPFTDPNSSPHISHGIPPSKLRGPLGRDLEV